MAAQLELELRQSCPQGFTRDDLGHLFSAEELKKFYKWMYGQTGSVCNGERYHHDRAHGDWCGHKADDPEYTYKCEYVGTGWAEATECAGKTHGMVVYRWDVERYVEGGWAKEIFD